MKEKYKHIITKHESVLAFLYSFIERNRILVKGKGNVVSCKGVFMSHTNISITGNSNTVRIQKGLTQLKNCSFFISGNNNKIVINRGCKLKDVSLYIEDSGGIITIGKNTIITGHTHMAVIEGTSISVGDGCLFSQNITLRTGDSHSIINESGNRINPSRDIIIGNHVWVGNTVIILKGSHIGDNSVVATGSILTGKESPANSIIGGIGGNILKNGINWIEERIPIQE